MAGRAPICLACVAVAAIGGCAKPEVRSFDIPGFGRFVSASDAPAPPPAQEAERKVVDPPAFTVEWESAAPVETLELAAMEDPDRAVAAPPAPDSAAERAVGDTPTRKATAPSEKTRDPPSIPWWRNIALPADVARAPARSAGVLSARETRVMGVAMAFDPPARFPFEPTGHYRYVYPIAASSGVESAAMMGALLGLTYGDTRYENVKPSAGIVIMAQDCGPSGDACLQGRLTPEDVFAKLNTAVGSARFDDLANIASRDDVKLTIHGELRAFGLLVSDAPLPPPGARDALAQRRLWFVDLGPLETPEEFAAMAVNLRRVLVADCRRGATENDFSRVAVRTGSFVEALDTASRLLDGILNPAPRAQAATVLESARAAYEEVRKAPWP